MHQQTITLAITVTYNNGTWPTEQSVSDDLSRWITRLNEDVPFVGPYEALMIDDIETINYGPITEVEL